MTAFCPQHDFFYDSLELHIKSVIASTEYSIVAFFLNNFIMLKKSMQNKVSAEIGGRAEKIRDYFVN